MVEEEGRRLRNWSRVEEKRKNDKVRLEIKEREEGKEVSQEVSSNMKLEEV